MSPIDRLRAQSRYSQHEDGLGIVCEGRAGKKSRHLRRGLGLFIQFGPPVKSQIDLDVLVLNLSSSSDPSPGAVMQKPHGCDSNGRTLREINEDIL